MKRRVILRNDIYNLRILDIDISKSRLETVYYTEHYDTYVQTFNAFSSRYEVTFSIRADLLNLLNDDELEVKLIKLYDTVKNKQRHPVLVKYILYHYSLKAGIPLYKLPVKHIYYSNEHRSEREISINAFVKSIYRLVPVFERILI